MQAHESTERPLVETEQEKTKSTFRTWLERMGVGAFLFFFIKGLVWLAVFAGLIKACN